MEKIANRLRTEIGPQVHSIEIGPSAVPNSPHDYVFVFLTREEHGGPHIIVSEASEHDKKDDGFFIGSYFGGDDGEEPWQSTRVNNSETRVIEAVISLKDSLVRELDRRHRTMQRPGGGT